MQSEVINDFKYCDMQKRAFARLGVDFEANEGEKILKKPIKWLIPLCGSIVWISALTHCTIKYRADVDKFVQATTILTSGVLNTLKMAVFLGKGRKAIRLTRALHQLAKSANMQESEIWLTENRRDQLIAKIYFTICWSTAVMALSIPLVYTLITYERTGTVILLIPFPGIFPYDYTRLHYNLLTFVLSILFIECMLDSSVGVDCLFSHLIFNFSAHFRILCLKVQQLAKDIGSCNITFEHFHWKITNIVNYHIHLTQLANEFTNVFAPVIFMEVLMSLLQVCVIIYQVVSFPQSIPLMIMAVGVYMTQLMIYCLGGEKLQSECLEFCNAIYMSLPWHCFNSKMKRLIVLPLQRAQQNSTLSGYFFTVDHNLMVWIFRSAGSFAAALLALKQN